MGILQENFHMSNVVDNSPLSKRRRFVPENVPMIEAIDNSAIENHTFDSPLILQLCEQAPSQAEIEASLAEVGMRVRKSIANGYKDSPERKKFTPRPFFNVHRLSPSTQAALCNAEAPVVMRQPMNTIPFCGVSLAYLSHSSDDWSNPEVGQQSLWSYTTSHKRSMEADSDSEDSQEWLPQTPKLTAEYGTGMPVDYFNIDPENMSDVSPMIQVGERFRREAGRKVAKPRSRFRNTPMEEAPAAVTSAFNPFANMQLPQAPQQNAFVPSSHKRMLSCGLEMNMMSDYSDAPFLHRREDMDMDCS